jgi:hypothetical protein
MTIPNDDLPDQRMAELLRGVRRDIRPGRDLWPGIEGRLKRRGGETARRRVWIAAGAMAAGIILTVILIQPPVRRPDDLGIALESAEVQQTLIATTGPRSATAHSLAHYLAILDAAIEETATALRETSDDPALTEFLQTLERRRLTLLAQAARFAAES